MQSYWSTVLDKRISRRRALAATGATAAAAAFLAACGGGDEGGTSGAKKDASGLLSEPEDTSKSARKGGVFKWSTRTEPLHFDGVAQGQSQLNVFNYLAYSSLVDNKPGYKELSTYAEVIPDLAESWEFSPDRTQITFKLRQGVKFHNKPPVNGRLFDSSDVIATWNRWVKLPQANNVATANIVNPNAPVLSVTAPDARTVVYKLKEPASYIMQRLARMVTGEAGTVQPREAGESFNPRDEQIGTGGFILDKHTPSVALQYKRNPEYWDKEGGPYVDTIEVPIVPEYAAGLSQFRAGNIYYYQTEVRQEDVIQTKRDVMQLGMYADLDSSNSPGAIIRFGWLPFGSYQKSPFLDVRVRQAVSLTFDRDAFIDAFSNVSNFQKEGLPIETYYYSSMGIIPGVTLDPRSKDFGPNAKYYTQDIAEAKKLLAAAGFTNGIELESRFVAGGQIGGPTHANEVQVLDNWAREAGFKTTNVPIDYNTDYLGKIVTKRGAHEGWAYTIGAVSTPDPVDYFVWRYWSKAGGTSGDIGLDVNGRGDGSGDPEVDALIEKAAAEPDVNRQRTLLHDLQRYLGKMQYCVTRPGIADRYLLAWPAVGNFQVFRGTSKGNFYHWWLDDAKAPVKKA